MCGYRDISTEAERNCRDFFPLRLLWQLHCIVSTGAYKYWENLKIVHVHTNTDTRIKTCFSGKKPHTSIIGFSDNLRSQWFYLLHAVLNSALIRWYGGVAGSGTASQLQIQSWAQVTVSGVFSFCLFPPESLVPYQKYIGLVDCPCEWMHKCMCE